MRGKVVLITGASSGIGAGTASHFASLGCLLSLTGRNQDRLKETLSSCIQAGSKEEDVLLIPADLQDTDSLSSIVQKTLEKFGRIDVLINNAGISRMLNFENTTLDDYDDVMNTNMKPVFFLTQNVMPHLIKSKGCVVNVSSLPGHCANKHLIAYSMSKAALNHFTRIVALDVASKGVRVNAVCPAMIKTPIWDRMGKTEMYDKDSPKCHALGRGGTVEEVVAPITFLADSTKSSFVTGVTLLIDGGRALLGPI